MNTAVLARLRVGNWVWLIAILSAASWVGLYLPLLLIRSVGDDGGGMELFLFYMSIWCPALVVATLLEALVATGCLFMTGTRVRKIVALLAAINAIIFLCVVLPVLLE